MIVFGIETSCDETAAAIVKSEKQFSPGIILSNVVTSSIPLHAKTGGIIPEIAAREQIRYIIPVMQQALYEAFGKNLCDKDIPIDAIAVTYGPGLIGSLLVGVETARTLSYVWEKPLIPINHLYGHIFANFLAEKTQKQQKTIEYPAISLVVSGGHTDLLLIEDSTKIHVLGGTRDDAAGEAFDKIGRLLGIPYPAGAVIAKRAEEGNPQAFRFPRPMINTEDFDFSFSGLKTAVVREIKTVHHIDDKIINDLCASVQQAIVDVLVHKTLTAAKKYKAKSILLGGGVAANEKLRQHFTLTLEQQQLSIQLFVPPPKLCTDNAAMIAAAAIYYNKPVSWMEITADPELYY